MSTSQATPDGEQAVFRAIFRKRQPSTISETPNTDELSPPTSTTLETFKDQQSNILPHNKLMIVFPTIALAQMVSYLDQTSVSTAVPAIGASLNMGPSISWIATSFLLASTSVQLVNGRLSDIVGRKPLLLTCMGILAGANLCAGFAQNAAMLFAFRSIAGLGGGAIDITTLEQRGKYNGFIGAMVGLGNGIGPLIGGALTQRASWRWCFWFVVPVTVVVMVVIAIVIPPSTVRGNAWTKVRMIDWLGLMVNLAAVVLVLIPISQGGSTYAWNSALVIAMLAIGGLLILTFVLVEWKFAKLPMMPSKPPFPLFPRKGEKLTEGKVRLFQSDKSANLILLQGTLHGIVYWANLFYIPMYLQTVRGYSPIMSGVIILPMVASHGIGSLVSGQIISKTGHYGPTIIFSNCVWLVGVSLQTTYTRTNPVWAICLIGFFQGIGIGGAFQLSGTILNNTLKTHLQNTLPPNTINTITSSAYALSSINLSPSQYEMVMDAYMAGMHTIFVMDEGVAEKDAKTQTAVPLSERGFGGGGEGVLIHSPPGGRQDQV
ncbi:hypothetical protein ZTR_05603 [Talaromyces verruculosus]|nr:hypothetical protein ZTR_05603 [Talaromyces verruculosus]